MAKKASRLDGGKYSTLSPYSKERVENDIKKILEKKKQDTKKKK